MHNLAEESLCSPSSDPRPLGYLALQLSFSTESSLVTSLRAFIAGQLSSQGLAQACNNISYSIVRYIVVWPQTLNKFGVVDYQSL